MNYQLKEYQLEFSNGNESAFWKVVQTVQPGLHDCIKYKYKGINCGRINFNNQDDREDIIMDFWETKGKTIVKNYNTTKPLLPYLRKALDNFTLDYLEKEGILKPMKNEKGKTSYKNLSGKKINLNRFSKSETENNLENEFDKVVFDSENNGLFFDSGQERVNEDELAVGLHLVINDLSFNWNRVISKKMKWQNNNIRQNLIIKEKELSNRFSMRYSAWKWNEEKVSPKKHPIL